MTEVTIALTTSERRRLDLAAAAMGKSPEQMVADELRFRYGLRLRAADVVELRASANEVSDGHD